MLRPKSVSNKNLILWLIFILIDGFCPECFLSLSSGRKVIKWFCSFFYCENCYRFSQSHFQIFLTIVTKFGLTSSPSDSIHFQTSKDRTKNPIAIHFHFLELNRHTNIMHQNARIKFPRFVSEIVLIFKKKKKRKHSFFLVELIVIYSSKID